MANPLYDLDIETVLEIRETALTHIKQGLTVMNFSSEGTSANLQFAKNPWQVLELCNQALRYLDPTTYGPIVKRLHTICG